MIRVPWKSTVRFTCVFLVLGVADSMEAPTAGTTRTESRSMEKAARLPFCANSA